ncbi:cell wall hydrolase [Domibacillus epiphyticus]|uniref:Cell wall hydrolase n=2 Tax=Domibacillus epiphyticus TaxID=1714355 RepID=A0A1V2ABX5_9BACI|nr:cell wall hydrolase [Domibacillus epiphyticus]
MIVSLFSINTKTHAAGFVDVPSRALKEVNYLVEGQVVSGSTPTTFTPYKTITRSEAAVFIGRALQLNGKQRATSFKDVGSGSFASGYIQSAADKGIMSGYGSSFRPYKVVTRGEMAVMIAKAFGYSSSAGAEKALMNLGIASGLSNGTFGSNQTITRADFAVFLARAINPEFRLKQSAKFMKNLVSTTGNLNIRSGPSTSYRSVGKIAANTPVTGAHSIGGWTYVKTEGKVGYISTYYLRTASTGNTVPPTLTENNDSKLSSQTIILDPGHGGKDSGAVGNGLKEKEVVLKTGLQVNNLLKQTPFNVKMTRSNDTFIELKDRSAFAKNNDGDIFVSIHANAATPSATGTETYYYSAGNPHVADSKLLASKIQARMLTAWNLRDRGVKNGNFSVLRENNMPAALLELGFISNAGDASKMASDYWMNTMSKAIYNGILDYYKAKGYNVNSLYK